MITQELKELVEAEAQNLRKYATKEEKDRLNLKTMISRKTESCIYAQMTGWCYSTRAVELLKKCSTPYSVYVIYFVKGVTYKNNRDRDFSPIEFYICQEGAKIEDLINLIKS